MSRLLTLARNLAVSLQPLAVLVTRLVLGWAFFKTGHGKWEHLDKTTEFFASLDIPAPGANAAFVALLEMVGGLMLMVGLGTRVIAALLTSTLIVALMTADKADLFAAFDTQSNKGFFDVTPIPFMLPLLWLVAFGAGVISLDRILFSKVGQSADKA